MVATCLRARPELGDSGLGRTHTQLVSFVFTELDWNRHAPRLLANAGRWLRAEPDLIEFHNRGDYPTALRAVEVAAERAPESISLQKRWGRLALAAGRLDVAVQAYRAATSLDPQDADAWIGLGEAHMKAGHNADARAAFDAAVGLPGGRERALEHVRSLRADERTDLQGSPRLGAVSVGL